VSGLLHAAVGRRDITPPVGYPAGAWSNQLHEVSEGNDLELWATVLIAEDSAGERIAIADLDLGVLTDQQAARARRLISDAAELPIECVSVGVTHSHCGPVTGGVNGAWIRQGRDQVAPYVERVMGALAEAAAEAAGSLRPVRVGSATGTSALAVNRRMTTPSGEIKVGVNEDGPVDRTLTVVRLDGEDEKPVATIVHYAAHPIILGAENRIVTPEYPGIVKRMVESTLGGHCLFIQGAAGDIGPSELFVGDLEVYRRLGSMIAHDAAAVALRASWRAHRQRLLGGEASAWIASFDYEEDAEPDATVACASESVPVPLSTDLGDAAEWAAAAVEREEALYAARAAGAPDDEIRELTVQTKFAVMRAERAAGLSSFDGTYPLLVQGMRIGPVALLGVPVEIFTEIGAEIRDSSPFATTLVSGYWNGCQYYLPTDAERARGGYEVDISPLQAGSPALLIEGAERVLASLAGAGDRRG
jgi:hypothetical protein